ncbi:MAG: hypothetical protein ACREUC_23915 [Steroidobacteraceae bacterium]
MDVELIPSRVFRAHCAAIVALIAGHWTFVALDLAGHHGVDGLPRLFYMGNEANVPAFFSALALTVAAVLAGLIARAERLDPKRAGRWLAICALLLFMAFDEAASIHELFDHIGARLSNDGIFYYAWVIPYGLLAMAVSVTFFMFWRRLPARTRSGLAAAAAVYCAGALGMELLQSALVAQAGEAAYKTLRMNVYITMEEGVEMLGVALLIRTLLIHLASEKVPQLLLRFGMSSHHA